jgi:hypothetical protein
VFKETTNARCVKTYQKGSLVLITFPEGAGCFKREPCDTNFNCEYCEIPPNCCLCADELPDGNHPCHDYDGGSHYYYKEIDPIYEDILKIEEADDEATGT